MTRSPRTPALVYCALTIILIVLVATLAFSSPPPTPPQIAELTPQAQHQIAKAPNQLGSNVGSAAGGQCSGSGPCGAGAGPGGGPGTTLPPTTTPGGAPATPIDVAAVHHCYGNPPRQIPDTQSPPCVAYWAGNNGGATSPGVTANQINVILWSTQSTRVGTDLQNFFNRYFEFYGRKLNIIQDSNWPQAASCAEQESAIDGVVQAYHPFASDIPDNTGEQGCGMQAFARDHVVSVASGQLVPESFMSSYSPYAWSYSMSLEGQEDAIGDFICAQLAGKKAVYSPDPTIASSTRKFGLIFEHDVEPYDPSTAPLGDALARCGASLAVTAATDGQGGGGGPTWAENAMLEMQQKGVTTVVCICSYEPNNPQYLTASADSQHYYPEWLVVDEKLAWNVFFPKYWTTPEERKGAMGMTFWPAQVPYADEPYTWAINQVDPGGQPDPDASLYLQADLALYWHLLAIASGIQMAGPDLTPYSFQRGLQAAHFPNPYSPEMEGVVGFAGGSHAMTTDAAVMWWDDAAQGPYPSDPPGAWCYVDGAERFSRAGGNWATPMNLFNGTCQASPPGT